MAAGGTPGNVTLGPGRLYMAPVGTTEPTLASTALPSAWLSVGYTEEGTAFSVEISAEAVEVAEELDPLRWVNTRRVASLAIAMAETTKRNLYLALGGGAGGTNTAGPLALPTPGAEVAVMLVWDFEDTPTATNTRWLFRQAKPSGTIELANRKAPQKRLIAVTFNLEKPTGLDPFTPIAGSSGLV
jgi:hypothetical protein